MEQPEASEVMKLGAVFPTCEIGNDPGAIRDFAQTAEGLGYSHLIVYDHVLGEVEPPLFEAVLDYTRGNQSRAAEILGLNRATLRKKLKQYELLG